MAKLPASTEELIAGFGPHLAHEPPGGFAGRGEPDRKVQTHCCFCGQQCGVQLLVKDEKVIGLEPWEDFPFNRGKLCPKGVKRYLQNNHRDRLTAPLARTSTGFIEITWKEALDTVAQKLRGIQAANGDDSFAVLSGASLTNEKAYLMGKFARVAVGTRHIDYNGRLCMVSAGAGNLKAFGIDRAANPWDDIAETELIFVTGSNVSECSPVTTDYIWRARDRGAKLIVCDPRITPIARTAELYLPVRPGTDTALMNGILRAVVEMGGVDEEFVAAHTNDFETLRAHLARYRPEDVQQIVGIPAKRIRQAAEMWTAASRSMLLHARGIEHHTKGVDNVLSCINLVLATGRIGKPGCGYSTITGQGNGQGAREHGQRCNQLPGARDIENPEHRRFICDLWGIDEARLPGKGETSPRIIELAHAGDIKGLLSICYNPMVSLPDANFTREALEKLEFYVAIDFFLSETARHADIVLPGSLQEEDEGTVTNVEGRVLRIRKAVDPPGQARADWQIIQDIATAIGCRRGFTFESPGEIFDELRAASRGGIADYYGITYEKIEANHGVPWPCPETDHPGTPRLFEDGRFNHPDGRARFHALEYRPSADPTDEEFPIWLTSGRVVSQFLSGNQTRRIGPLVDLYPEPVVEMHSKLATKLGIVDGQRVRIRSRRDAIELAARVTDTIRPDTVFVPYHWPGEKSVNRLTHRSFDPVSGIPEFKVSAVSLEPLAEVAA